MTKQDLLTAPTALDLANISVRLYQVHKDLIDRAAALVPGRTPSDYVRDTMSMQAALDLGVELPHVPDITRGRGGSLVAQAAAKLGMSREEFELAAVRKAAAEALGADALDDRPITMRPPRASTPAPRQSERAPSGTYARRDVQSERPRARTGR